MHTVVKSELESLQSRFEGKTHLTLDDYAALYEIGRQNASRHLKRRGIPVTKDGKSIYISLMDLAIYKAKCRVDNSTLLLPPIGADEMKRRRGFNQQADMRQLKNTK